MLQTWNHHPSILPGCFLSSHLGTQDLLQIRHISASDLVEKPPDQNHFKLIIIDDYVIALLSGISSFKNHRSALFLLLCLLLFVPQKYLENKPVQVTCDSFIIKLNAVKPC